MGHNHAHSHTSKNILVAFFLNATFAVIELIGGYLTNSVAIYSDAIHDLGDSLALLFSYFAEKFSKKEADQKYTFGYRRFSIFSAVVNALILLSGSIFVISEALQRIQNPEAVKPEGMIFLAILGIVVNSYAAIRMSKNEELNSKMITYHLLEDILGWVAVFIVSIVLLFKSWFVLDSILSILISAVILIGVYKNFRKAINILLQKFPEEINLKKLKEEVSEIKAIEGIHKMRGWSLDGQSHYLSCHVRVDKNTRVDELGSLRARIKKILKKYNVVYSSVEFESECLDA